MQKQIGKVILDYTYYKGEDLYSDGDIEDELLDIVKNRKQQEALYSSNIWPILYHLSDIRENLLEWYPFCDNANILEIGSGCGALTGLLSKKAKQVTCIELSEKRSLINAYRNIDCDNIKILIGNFEDIDIKEKYDYITLIGVWEYSGLYLQDKCPYIEMLKNVRQYLKENGKIIIAIENKTGIKYWNGAAEDHTGNLFSGINDYTNDSKHVRTFSKPEIENIFKDLEISKYSFYYPMPDYKLPDVIYTDDFLPVPGMERNYGKDYSSNRVYLFNDAVIMDQICSDNMFTYFANSFLIVIGEDKKEHYFEKYNRCRKAEFRIKTEIYEKNNVKYVMKSALDEKAAKYVFALKENEEKWKGCLPNLNCVEGNIENGNYIVPYIEGEYLESHFYKYRHDVGLFIEKFFYYKEKYLTPRTEDLVPFQISDRFISIFGEKYPNNQMSLRCSNIDLIFSNLILTSDDKLFCFDYEWVFDFLIPYEYLTWRTVSQLYIRYMPYLMQNISKEQFFLRMGIDSRNISVYKEMDKHFNEFVFGSKEKEYYLSNYRKTALRQNLRFV